jgi:hypothetical protein
MIEIYTLRICPIIDGQRICLANHPNPVKRRRRKQFGITVLAISSCSTKGVVFHRDSQAQLPRPTEGWAKARNAPCPPFHQRSKTWVRRNGLAYSLGPQTYGGITYPGEGTQIQLLGDSKLLTPVGVRTQIHYAPNMKPSRFTYIYDDDLTNYDMENNPMGYNVWKLSPRGIKWNQGSRLHTHMFGSAGHACELPDSKGFALVDISKDQKGSAYFIDLDGNVFDKIDISPKFTVTKANFSDLYEGHDGINFIFMYDDNSPYDNAL